MGFKKGESGFAGRSHSQETKDKIRESLQGRPQGPNHVNQFEKPDIREKACIRSMETKARMKAMKPYMYRQIQEELMKTDEQGLNYAQRYVKSLMKAALEDPNSQSSKMFGGGIFNEALFDSIDKLNARSTKDELDFRLYQLRKTLFDKQQEVFDNEQDKEMLIICTRRAGKTELNVRLAIKDIMKPNHHVLYINRVFDNAARQLGVPLLIYLESNGIPYKGSPAGGEIEFENGSTILFMGYDNKAELDKRRGDKYSLIIIDEVGHLRNLKPLMREVLEPTTVDYGKEAQIVYTGTPPRVRASYVNELWANPNIKKYHWSFMDNPFIPDKEFVIFNACKRNGVNESSLFIQREYYGCMDAYDEDALVFKSPIFFKELPKQTWQYAWVGVDWGFEDDNAVVSVVTGNDGRMYIIDSWIKGRVSNDERVAEIHRQYQELQKLNPVHPVTVITDTNEKTAAYDLQFTHHIPNVALAYKYNKDIAIEQFSDWLKAGTIQTKAGISIADDYKNTVWRRDENDVIIHDIDDATYHPNAVWAAIYVSRQFAYQVLMLTDDNKEAKPI